MYLESNEQKANFKKHFNWLKNNQIKVVCEIDYETLSVEIKTFNAEKLVQTDKVPFDKEFYSYYRRKISRMYEYFKK